MRDMPPLGGEQPIFERLGQLWVEGRIGDDPRQRRPGLSGPGELGDPLGEHDEVAFQRSGVGRSRQIRGMHHRREDQPAVDPVAQSRWRNRMTGGWPPCRAVDSVLAWGTHHARRTHRPPLTAPMS
jgi:hypothetical protein